jgi:pSer/pThr/pTyr-binding forkhead associated (FHA) protein
MFAVEVTFLDQRGGSETVLLRRPTFVIGSDPESHLILEELKGEAIRIKVARGLGAKFKVDIFSDIPGHPLIGSILYERLVTLNFAAVSLTVFLFDIDLHLLTDESLDSAGVRLAKRAMLNSRPHSPSLVVEGRDLEFSLSFPPDMSLQLGRGANNDVRIEVPEVSSQHARVGIQGGRFWVEDLGSTNGTFIGTMQVAGRTEAPLGSTISLSRVVNCSIVSSQGARNFDLKSDPSRDDEEDLERDYAIGEPTFSLEDFHPDELARYPVLVSLSEIARPARIALKRGTEVKIGRDPASDLWLGAPHISRLHCLIRISADGVIGVTDLSTNGTYFGSDPLPPEEEIVLTSETSRVLNFGSGVTVALCFNENEEQEFSLSDGSLITLSNSKELPMKGRVSDSGNIDEVSKRTSSLQELRKPKESRGSSGKRRPVAPRQGRRATNNALSSDLPERLLESLRTAGAPLVALVLVSLIFLLSILGLVIKQIMFS